MLRISSGRGEKIIEFVFKIKIPDWLEKPLAWPVLLYRRIRYGYPFRRIPLTQGKYAIVDPDDYYHLSKHKWYAARRHETFYAVRAVKAKNGKRRQFPMHRSVLKLPRDIFVDHANRNGLDNRKANLRPATRAQNMCNRAKYTNRTYGSKYKGVTYNRTKDLYQAQIQLNRKYIFLGFFPDQVQAARAYDRAAKKYHGEFASLNFPQPKRSRFHCVTNVVRTLLNCLAYFSSRFPHRRPRLAVAGTATQPLSPHVFGGDQLRHSTFDILHSIFAFPASPLTAQPVIHKVATMAKKLYIIDGHAHIYAAYYAPMRQQLTSPTGEPTQATYIFTTAILGLIQRQNPDMLVVAMDSKAPTFRSEIYTEYKANRPPMPDDMPAQIDRIEQILDAMNIPVLRLDGFEADDIMGTLAKKAGADGYDCLICSKDKDILQLLDDHISAFDIKTDTSMDPAAMLEQKGIAPAQFIDCLALQGDTSDNIPGIPDVGPKTALDWIQKYGSIENLYKHIDEIKGKRGDNLRKFEDNIALSKELVTIDCNVPLEIDYKALAVKKFNEAKLTRIFTELGFNRLLTQLGLTASNEHRVSYRASSIACPP